MSRAPAVDLYSDTLTRPTAAMRDAMAAAEVGDEQLGEDPSVNRLCADVAARLGQEAALFLPTGTMCNLVAVATLTRHGDAVIADAMSHIARSEAGGAAAVSGVMCDLLDGPRGQYTTEQLRPALAPGTVHRPHPSLVCIEQTHNFGGGTVWDIDHYRAVVDLAHQSGVAVHVDGARLYNAVVASGVDATEWGGIVDSVWIDFTKGLGAPIGAALAGSAEFIQRARVLKQRFGGAMRQAGVAAAGCSHALDHHVDRLADDHANAARLADGLEAAGHVVQRPVETNMVWIDPSPTGRGAAELAGRFLEDGVRLSVVGERLRAVTHLDVTADQIDVAVSVAAGLRR